MIEKLGNLKLLNGRLRSENSELNQRLIKRSDILNKYKDKKSSNLNQKKQLTLELNELQSELSNLEIQLDVLGLGEFTESVIKRKNISNPETYFYEEVEHQEVKKKNLVEENNEIDQIGNMFIGVANNENKSIRNFRFIPGQIVNESDEFNYLDKSIRISEESPTYPYKKSQGSHLGDGSLGRKNLLQKQSSLVIDRAVDIRDIKNNFGY